MHLTTPAKPSVDRSKSADRDGFHRQKGWCHPSGRIWSRRLCARTGNRDKDTRVLSAGPAGVLTAQLLGDTLREDDGVTVSLVVGG